MSQIQQEAGIKSADAAAASSGAGGVNAVFADLLEGEFDPEEYDRRMAAAFSDSYYQVGHRFIVKTLQAAVIQAGCGSSGCVAATTV